MDFNDACVEVPEVHLETIPHYRQKLLEIIGQHRHYVKLLRAVRADHLANELLHVHLAMDRLAADRRRFRAVTYIDRCIHLIRDHDQVISRIRKLYPKIAKPLPDLSGLMTKKVSITLREDQWIWLDQLITNKEYRSRSQFFRQLFNRLR